jgi:hypothetical protein
MKIVAKVPYVLVIKMQSKKLGLRQKETFGIKDVDKH